MKNNVIVWTALGALLWAGCADVSGDPDLALDSDEARGRYSLGHAIGNEMRSSIGDTDAAFIAGLNDALEDASRMTQEEMATALASLEQQRAEAAAVEQLAEAEKNQAEGDAFRVAFGEGADTVTLESGLQYEILVAGDGAVPGADDPVTVHYRGSFVDGTQFDSSYDRQVPAKFRAGRVIEGWTEALTRMPVGSKWKVVIPPDLAYGDSGAGGVIGPRATLVFELELLEIG